MMGFGGGGVGGLAPLPTSAIYVSNLPSGTDEDLLADHFGKIGLLKVRNYFFSFSLPSPPSPPLVLLLQLIGQLSGFQLF
jgi:RNA recognition motif-containing protein